MSDENSDDKPAEPPPAGQPSGVPEKPVAERSMLDKPDDERSIQDKSLNDKSVVLSDDPGPLPPQQDLDVVDVRHGMFGGIGTGDTSGSAGGAMDSAAGVTAARRSGRGATRALSFWLEANHTHAAASSRSTSNAPTI